MDEIGVLGVFCGAASLSGILLALHFFFSKSRRSEANVVLGILFLTISFRIAKSVWHYVFFDYAKLGVAQGFVSMCIMGPAIYLYILRSTRPGGKRTSYLHALWVVPAVIIAVIEPISFRFLYKYAPILIFSYLLLAIYQHFKTDYQSEPLRKFNQFILGGVTLIGAALVFQHAMEGVRYYTYGAAFASVVIYGMLFQVLSKAPALARGSINQVDDQVLAKVREIIEQQQVFLRPGITLSDFASEFNVPAYLVTRSVTQAYAKTFPETMNHFRVEEVKRRLMKGDNKQLKIEGIAAEAGFTTPSAFYAAFKKETGATPTQFVKSHQ